MDRLDQLRAFVATARSGGFTAAAEQLGISNRLTSKYVAELEASLGVRLLQRTTRRVGVTPAGEEMLARAPMLLDELDALIAQVSEGSQSFSGTLRLAAPATFGEVFVAGMLGRFGALHPGLSFDLRLTDTHVDLASEGIDLAFRIGEPGTLSLKARKLGSLSSLVVASPSYLERNGTPERPEDLEAHRCILDTNRRQPRRWRFLVEGEEVSVTVSGPFSVNSARAACDLAAEGHGIAFVPRFAAREGVAAGRLVTLLTGIETESHPLAAVYLEGRALPAKLRALIDFAAEDLRRQGPL